MRIILFGPPGSGKGTQAKLLAQRERLDHIGTGDLLRAAIRQQTAVGVRAKSFVENGRLVPDDMVNNLVSERFAGADRPTRFVMDGYPRTVGQAGAFDAVLHGHQLDLSGVIALMVRDEEIVRRLGGRWNCPNASCGASYHTENHPPRAAGVCDECGAKLVQRADDKPETVRARLAVYHRDTAEVIPYYRKQGLLREVPGSGEIEQIYAAILNALQPQAGRSC